MSEYTSKTKFTILWIGISVFVLFLTGCTSNQQNNSTTSEESVAADSSWVSAGFTANSDANVAYKWTDSSKYAKDATCYLFSGNGSVCHAMLVEVKRACRVDAGFSLLDKDGVVIYNFSLSSGNYAAKSDPISLIPNQKGLILFSTDSRIATSQIAFLGCM